MIVDVTDAETSELVRVLYSSFPSGAEFEAFLKVLLTRMGLQDVAVTRYSKDGGIDLVARRTGLEELSRVDEVQYVVQAKRYQPERVVPIDAVRALRGVLKTNDKGLLVTTGRFSAGSESFAAEDPFRPIVLIDGERLIRLCIDHRLGFRFRPVFDAGALAEVLRPVAPAGDGTKPGAPVTKAFTKTITSNDIRARIISVPWELDALLPGGAESISVTFPPHFPAKHYAYRRDRRFIAGVTEVLRRFGLLLADGERVPHLAEWTMTPMSNTVSVRISQQVV